MEEMADNPQEMTRDDVDMLTYEVGMLKFFVDALADAQGDAAEMTRLSKRVMTVHAKIAGILS